MDSVNIGDIIPLSLCDWPGKSVAVVFLAGCPYDCKTCHNKKLKSGGKRIDVKILKKELENYLEFLDGIVISGGEPLTQLGVLDDLITFAHRNDKLIAVETAAYNSESFIRLMNKNPLDCVFLDIKTELNNIKYKEITGCQNHVSEITKIVKYCKNMNIPITIRTTVFENYPNKEELNSIENYIKENELVWVKQGGN